MTDDVQVYAGPPRIVTSPSWGNVTQADIDTLVKIYRQIPEKYRILIEERDLGFSLGKQAQVPPSDSTKRTIYVPVASLYGKKKFGPVHATTNLLRAVWTGPADIIQWDDVCREYRNSPHADPAIKQGTDDLIIAASIERALKPEAEHRSEKPFPKAKAMVKAYLDSASKQAEDIKQQRNERWKTQYQASETAFAINTEPGVLTKPQQEYLETINRSVQNLGVTPQEFDNQFRIQLAEQIGYIALQLPAIQNKLFLEREANEQFLKIAPSHAEKMTTHTEQVFKSAKAKVKYSGKLKSTSVTHTDRPQGAGALVQETAAFFTNPKKNLAKSPDVEAMENAGATLTGNIFTDFDNINIPVRYYTPRAIVSNEEERAAWKIPKSPPQVDNLLQQLAAGLISFPAFAKVQDDVRVLGIKFTPPSAIEFVHNALIGTVEELGKKKAVDVTQSLSDLNGFTPLLDRITKTPREIAAEEAEVLAGAQREEERLLAVAEKAKTEGAAKLAEEERLKKLPAAFVITGPIYTRIVQEATRRVTQHTPPAQQTLSRHMEALHAQITPFSNIDTLNAKNLVHRKLGDALFNDAVLANSEALSNPANGDPQPLDGVEQERVKAAIAAVFTHENAPNQDTARTERLRSQLMNSPALIIAALGNQDAIKEFRDTQKTLLTAGSDTALTNEARQRQSAITLHLLNGAGANLPLPALYTIVFTKSGRVMVTEAAYAPPEDERLITFRPGELDNKRFDEFVEEAEKTLKSLADTAGRDKNFRLQSEYRKLSEKLLTCSINEAGERNALFQHIGHALGMREPMNMALEDTVKPPAPAQETTPPAEVCAYRRPISETRQLAEDFVYANMAKEPEKTLFCCYVDPSAERRNQLVLKVYHYDIEAYGRLVIPRDPAITRIATGDDIGHALDTMQDVQNHIVNMPGITSYVRIDNSRFVAPGDIILPNQAVINGPIVAGAHEGEIRRLHGKLVLHLEYGPPDQTEADIDLQLIQSTHNMVEARNRADAVIAEIQRRHGQHDIPTRNELEEWVVQQHGRVGTTAYGNVITQDIDFPAGEKSYIVAESPSHDGYPTESWNFNIHFKYNGHRFRHVNRTIRVHASDWEHAEERRNAFVSSVKYMLEHEADRARWDLIENDLLDSVHREPAEGPPHDRMDESRLMFICDIAQGFQTNHTISIRNTELLNDGGLRVTYGVQRTYHGDPVDEWFGERGNHANPAVLERSVTFPARMADPEDAAHNLEWYAQQLFERYLLATYSAFTAPDPAANNVQHVKSVPKVDDRTIRNFLEQSLCEGLEQGDGEFDGCSPDFTPSPENGNGHTNGCDPSAKGEPDAIQPHSHTQPGIDVSLSDAALGRHRDTGQLPKY